jgi:hypothetical protein
MIFEARQNLRFFRGWLRLSVEVFAEEMNIIRRKPSQRTV